MTGDQLAAYFVEVLDPVTGQVVGLRLNTAFGIMTDYWLKQPLPRRAGFTFTSGPDRAWGCYGWVENPTVAADAAVFKADATRAAPAGYKNTCFDGIATNAPAGNEGLHVRVQYAPTQGDYPVTPVVADEIDVDGTLLHRAYYACGTVAIKLLTSYWGAVLGGASKQLFP